MHQSRFFFLKVTSRPITEYTSGISPSIVSEFAKKIGHNSVDSFVEKKYTMVSPLEKFDYSHYEGAGNALKNACKREHCDALKWIEKCRKSYENITTKNNKKILIDGRNLDSGRYLVLDLETTTEKVNNRVANCFSEKNFIVLPGWLDYKGYVMIPPNNCTKEELQLCIKDGDFAENSAGQNVYVPYKVSHLCLPDLDNYDILVGHNLKFDLVYLWGDPKLRKFLSRGGRIWDTMYAEYLLEGHLGTIPQVEDDSGKIIDSVVRKSRRSGVLTLDTLAPKYGGTRKIDLVKKAWDAQVKTPEIPQEILAEYLAFDLKNTEIIYKGQMERALRGASLPLMHRRMDFILTICEAEHNGIRVEKPKPSTKNNSIDEKNIQDLIGEDLILRPDYALILTTSSQELIGIQRFLSLSEIKKNLFPETSSDLEANQAQAISHFSSGITKDSNAGSIYSFTWPNLKERCLHILLAFFENSYDCTLSNDSGEKEKVLQNFQRMCRYFVGDNEKLSVNKCLTKVTLEDSGKSKTHVLQRVNLCLPFANHIAFEESPYYKNRRFRSDFTSAFNLRSIENDPLNYFTSSVAQVCYGRIFRMLAKSWTDHPRTRHTQEWNAPNLSVDVSDASVIQEAQMVPDLKIIMCSTDGLWIDINQSSELNTKFISEIQNMMKLALREFIEMFDIFDIQFNRERKFLQLLNEPLDVNVEKIA